MSRDEGAGSERIRRLTEISRALTYARSLEDVLELTVDCAADLLASSQAILLLIGEDGFLHVRAARGVDEERVETFKEPLDEKLLDSLRTLLGPTARADRFLAVPLVVQGGVTGLLGVYREGPDPDVESAEWLLSAVADQAAVAIESTRHEEVRDALRGRVGELEARQTSKDEALEILSHDLRSPLNAIQGYASMLNTGILGPLNERQMDALARLKRVGDHMTTLLDNVLEMARLDSGRLTVESREVSLDGIVADAAEIVAPSAREAEIALDVTGSEALVLHTDPARLRQVLIQLLDNAVKYSPEGSSVRVSWRAVEHGGRSWAEADVTDQGAGITRERQALIFEPYVRADGDTPRARSGVGLGLSIATGLVRRMGGTLTVESEPGRGSTFRVRLPLD